MIQTIKKAPIESLNNSIKHTVIIAGKTYTVNELAPFFTRSALKFADKETLYKYWQMAVESGVKQFITNVDNAFNERYPRFE